FTDAGFFDVFNFQLVAGDPAKLDEPNHLFVSASFAKTIFGDEDPLGKSLTYYYDDIRSSLIIGGVFQDPPSNTHLQAHALASIDRVIQDALLARWFGDLGYEQFKWRWTNFHTYVMAPKSARKSGLKEQIDAVIHRHRGSRDLQAGRVNSVALHSLDELHFVQGFRNQIGPTANVLVLQMLRISAGLILLLAWINYVNLTSARSIRRARETGVRKILGAFKSQLIAQFLVETIVINLISLALAGLWVWLLAPAFQQTTGVDLFQEMDFQSLLLFAVLILLGILLAGVYPAVVLSGFKPTQTLKGKLGTSTQGKSIRSVLMLFQFTVVLILLSGVFVIRSQIQYMTQYDIGMETESVVTLSSPPGFMRDSTFHSRFEAMSQAIAQIPAIETSATATLVSGMNNWGGQSATMQNGGDLGSVFVFFNTIDERFVPFHDLELVAGRNFSKAFPSDQQGILINEMVARGYGLSPEEMLGKTLLFQGGLPDRKVIGVLKDFYPMGIKYTIEPMIFSLSGTDERYYLNLRIAGSNPLETIRQIEEEYVNFFPGTPIQIEFAENRLREIFANDQRIEVLIKFFSFVAMIISVLGIVGLTSFLINQKMKEVSIRKVLGASFADITSRFSREYIFLVAGASILGIPTSVYFARNWLENYQLRVSLHPIYFVYPVVILLAIICCIILLKTFRAAAANPTKHLRNE
ncbi:MAG: FtsX-like permease family protein, partial [Bacteroidota bacterium]